MCGDMLSSSWETENRKHGKTYEKYDLWGRKDIKEQLTQFHDQQVVKEFTEAVEQKRITEFYWCGGEPLMWKIHWEAMQRVLDLGYADQVLARYNSNMSRIKYFKKDLFEDILQYYPKFQICASIDGTGDIGEYIRTGLKYNEWYQNMKHGMTYIKGHEQRIQLDLTITLPGLFDLENMVKLADDMNTELLTKQVFNFSNDQAMAPLFMPYDIMCEIIDEAVANTKHLQSWRTNEFFAQLEEMKRQKRNNDLVYSSDEYVQGQRNGKKQIERLDKIRGTDITKILQKNKRALEWWTSI
jgi:sulfatase maturation enzyme AslB (radical SAM superfamily)